MELGAWRLKVKTEKENEEQISNWQFVTYTLHFTLYTLRGASATVWNASREGVVPSYNTVLRDFGSAKLRAQRSDGTVIAESPVASANAEGVNFILSIPVATASTAKSCTVGETLDCVLVTQEGTLDVPNSLKVASPTKVGKVTFNCTEVKSYTNPKDGTVVEIPTAYIAEAQWYLDTYMNGGAYDPWADYDNDGISNYGEFLAGTIPFDESDYLRVKEFKAKDGKFALKFEHVGGHVYAVSSANTLAKPTWACARMPRARSLIR